MIQLEWKMEKQTHPIPITVCSPPVYTLVVEAPPPFNDSFQVLNVVLRGLQVDATLLNRKQGVE